MKKFISTIGVFVLLFTISSCRDIRATDLQTVQNEKQDKTEISVYSKNSDSVSAARSDGEEPRRDPQQWRTKP